MLCSGERREKSTEENSGLRVTANLQAIVPLACEFGPEESFWPKGAGFQTTNGEAPFKSVLVDINIPEIEQGVMLRQSQPDVEMFDDLVLFNDANGEMYACLMRLGQFSMFVHHSVLAGREDA